MSGREKTAGISSAVFSFSTLYHFVYCILVSDMLFSKPLLGGAFFLFGRVTLQVARMRRSPRSETLTKRSRLLGTILVPFILILLLAITALDAVPFDDKRLWLLVAIPLFLSLRAGLTELLIERDLIRGKKARRSFAGVILMETLMSLPVAAASFFVVPAVQGWALLFGSLFGCVIDFLETFDDRARLNGHGPMDEEALSALRGANAYRQYQAIAMALTAATHLTAAITYAYLGLTADAVLYCMLTALGTMLLSIVLVDLVMRKTRRGHSDPGNTLMIGAAIWLYGVILFIRNFESPSLAEAYLSLGLCTFGSTFCARTLSYLDDVMRKVAAFTLKHEVTSAYDWSLRVRMEECTIIGQFLSLVIIALLEIFANGTLPDNMPGLLQRFRPIMAVPSLGMVILVLIASMRFPMSSQHLSKLDRYLHMREGGVENSALHEQLYSVIITKSLRHYGIALLKLFLRPLYRHKVYGQENVRLDEDVSAVFICNHGEMYGPIVTELYVPYPFRPWVTYEITDSKCVADYLYDTKISFQQWIPRRLRRPLCDRIVGPGLAWLMRQADSIPVYHGDTHQLMKTFRETVKAMEAGDNILLFPENSATSENGKFVREGVSEFFTGFTTIGQLYQRKTGKCCQFIPVYANQKKRTLRFGHAVRYDPDRAPTEEKDRICTLLRAEIMRMAELD